MNKSIICNRAKTMRTAHLLCSQAEVVGKNLSVAEPARLVIDDVFVVQLVVLVQILLKAFLL